MPASETVAISLGNWIVAFYVVYAMAAIALVAAAAVLIDWTLGMVRRGRLASQPSVGRRPRVIESRV